MKGWDPGDGGILVKSELCQLRKALYLREPTRPTRERALDRLREETGRALRGAPLAELEALSERLRGAAGDGDADAPGFGSPFVEAIGEALARYLQAAGRHVADVEHNGAGAG